MIFIWGINTTFSSCCWRFTSPSEGNIFTTFMLLNIMDNFSTPIVVLKSYNLYNHSHHTKIKDVSDNITCVRILVKAGWIIFHYAPTPPELSDNKSINQKRKTSTDLTSRFLFLFLWLFHFCFGFSFSFLLFTLLFLLVFSDQLFTIQILFWFPCVLWANSTIEQNIIYDLCVTFCKFSVRFS